MASPSLNAAHPAVRETYRDWLLTARWYAQRLSSPNGWICYVRRPGESDGLGSSLVFRRETAEAALADGRKWVDWEIAGRPRTRKKRPKRLLGRGKD